MTDHYATLGVAKTASQDEIKKAFRKLASQHHPDKGGDTAKFQEIQAAYDTLGDPDKRAAYDNPAPQFGGFGGGNNPFHNAQFNDIFSQMFGGGMGGGPFGQRPQRNHVRMGIWVSLADAARGENKMVSVSTSAGSNTIEIAIPQGIEDGDNVQYNGVAPGGMDLVLQFRIHPDARWRRDGQNLHTTKTISVWDLILGTDLEVETILGNRVVITVPPNTQPDTVMRVRNQGMPSKNQTGDLLLHFRTEIPRTIPAEITDAIRQYR